MSDTILSFIHAEHQFIKLAVLFILTVAVVLCSEVVLTYRNEEYIHEVHEYFDCLKVNLVPRLFFMFCIM